MEFGAEYYSKRGWAPKGDFRYRGAGLDRGLVNWSALFDRGVEIKQASGPQAGQFVRVNQGGTDIVAQVRRDFSPQTRLAGDVEYLSSYTYRLVFNDNYWQAVSSQVRSDLSLTHDGNGRVLSADFARLQTFDGATAGSEARIMHLPSLRYDVLDRPLAAGPVYWGLASGAEPVEPRGAGLPCPQRWPHRCLSAHFTAPGCRRMEPCARGGVARHVLLRQPGSRSDRHQQRRAHRQPRSAAPHVWRSGASMSASGA